MLQFGNLAISLWQLFGLIWAIYVLFIFARFIFNVASLGVSIITATLHMILITRKVMSESELKGSAIKLVIKSWKFKTIIVRGLLGVSHYRFNPTPTAKRIHKTLKKLLNAELKTRSANKAMFEDKFKHLMNEIKADLDKRKAERDDKLAQNHVRTIVISSKQGLEYVLDCVNEYLLNHDLSRLSYNLQYCIGFSKKSAGEISMINGNVNMDNSIVLITSDSGEPQSIIIMRDPEFDITPLVDADHPYWAKIKDNIPEDKPAETPADDSISDGNRV